MEISKYKYYFRKPRSEIVKDVFKTLILVGAISIAGNSPHFLSDIWKGYQKWRKYPKKKLRDAFSSLLKQGYVEVIEKNHQIFVTLTEEGRKKAGWLQIGALEIKKPKRWDGKWRLVIFDIAELKKIHREAFRGKLKELGFCQLQKSVWIYPYDCRAEIDLLRDFFGLNREELRLIVAEDVGSDRKLITNFDLREHGVLMKSSLKG